MLVRREAQTRDDSFERGGGASVGGPRVFPRPISKRARVRREVAHRQAQYAEHTGREGQ